MATVTIHTCESCGRDTDRLFDDEHCSVCHLYRLTASQENSCTALRMLSQMITDVIMYEGVDIEDVRSTVAATLSSAWLKENRPPGRGPVSAIGDALAAHEAFMRTAVA